MTNSGQYIYASGSWKRVQRMWLYQAGKWTEVYYTYVRASGTFKVAFIQNPSWMYDLTSGFQLFKFSDFLFGYINNDPDPDYDDMGTLVANPGAIAPSSPWRISGVYSWYREPSASEQLYTSFVRFRAPKNTPHPGPTALRSIGYQALSGLNQSRGRPVWPYLNYSWVGDNHGEALMQFFTNQYNALVPAENDFILENFPYLEDGRTIPWGVRFKL